MRTKDLLAASLIQAVSNQAIRLIAANLRRRSIQPASGLAKIGTILNRFWSEKSNRLLVGAAGCAIVGGIGAYLYAREEARRYRLEQVQIKTIGGAANGTKPINLKILHLSDLHLLSDDHLKADFLRKLTDDDFDMVVITGDIFENYGGVIHAGSLISRRPRLGTYAVLGNHDYYDYGWFHKTVGFVYKKHRHPQTRRNVDPMISALSDAGITVLRNSAVTLPDDNVHIVGIDFPGTTREHLSSLTAQAPEDFLVLTLMHVPHKLKDLDAAGVHVAFAGHTHGGQVRVPGIGALVTDSELHRSEASGIIRRGQTVIHVSRGLGADPRTNFRFFCPPAATLLEVEHFPRNHKEQLLN